MINSTERSDILVFNCYLCHVSFLLTCYVCSTKIGEISDISKCFENFVSQALGVLTRIYTAELRMKVFLLLLLLYFPLNSKVAEDHQVDVTLSYESGYISKSLYINGKKEAVYKSKKKKPIRLTKVEKDMQNIFFEQLKYLESWGVNIKYPEVIFEDLCIISDILSNYDKSEIQSFIQTKGDCKTINILKINKYYTYINARVDYVLTLTIVIEKGLLKEFRYEYMPDFSDETVIYRCQYKYDNYGRIIYITTLGKEKNEIRITYASLR